MIVELEVKHVIGINRKVIEFAHKYDTNCQQKHVLRDKGGLESCLKSIFYQDTNGKYLHFPIEKLAGLILYRIAQGQYFLDGNKRTALVSVAKFLGNNDYRLKIDEDETNGLIWGFGERNPDNSQRKTENDAVAWVQKNIISLSR